MKVAIKKYLLFAILLFLLVIPGAIADDNSGSYFSIGIYPGYGIPLGAEDASFFSEGGAGDIVLKYRFSQIPLLYAGGRLCYDFIPVEMDTAVSVISGGIEAGIIYSPVPWLSLSAGLSGGYFYGLLNDRSGPGGGNPYIKPSIGLDILIFPGFAIGIEGTYRNYLGLYQGAAVSVGGIFRITSSGETGPVISEPVPLIQAEQAERLGLGEVEFGDIFPVFYSYYDEHSIGSGTLLNNTDAAIENISLNIFIRQYMDSPKPCAAPMNLESGAAGPVDFYALFTDNILSITEGTKVSAELTLNYSFKDREYQETYIETVRIYNRNATTWDDDRKVAAFVTSKEPVVLELAKTAAGIARESAGSVISRNLRVAVALNQSLRLYGMSYVIDPETQYSPSSGKENVLDFLQFPRQTLQYRAGDCDDLSILNCALFEAVGIETAFITVPGHIYMAFQLGLSSDEVKKIFSSYDDFIIQDDTVWVPCEITDITGGFVSAWQTGIKEWREADEKGAAALYPTHEAWKKYEPVGLPGGEIQLGFPDDAAVREAYQHEFLSLVDREIYSRVKDVEERIASKGESARLLNRLGMLYAQYGLSEKAEENFFKVLSLDSQYVPALVNLGNIMFLKASLTDALSYYEQASALKPSNPAVLIGLARTHNELKNYGFVSLNYEKLKDIKPELAKQYAYLDMQRSEATRASAVKEMETRMIWEEDESPDD
jgi:transglutaminase-like putative cysteine protease